MMIKISACIIVKNEEKYIRKCLENIKNVVDEIVVVDGYSADKTVEICKEYTDNVYLHNWSGSFAEERNFSISKAANDWIFVIDADETLSKELQDNMKHLTQQNEYSAYAFTRRHYYDENGKKWTKHVFYPDYQIRLFHKDKTKYQGIIHEAPRVDGKTRNAPLELYINHYVPNHYSYSTFKNHHLRWAKIQARQTERTKSNIFYLVKSVFVFFYYFIKLFLIENWFLDGIVGFKASLMMASYFFAINYYITIGD